MHSCCSELSLSVHFSDLHFTGCLILCAWFRYDEPKLLGEVEKRLGAKIPEMDPRTMDLPPALKAALAKGMAYGEMAGLDTRCAPDK